MIFQNPSVAVTVESAETGPEFFLVEETAHGALANTLRVNQAELRALGANAGEFLELLDQPRNRFR